MNDEVFDPGMEDEPPRSLTIFDIIFSAIAVLASLFSGYTTYKGFSYDLPMALSLVIAVIVSLALLGINFKLRQQRILGDIISGTLVAFFVVFLFSFISNTNAIYTYFLENDIVKDTQTKAWSSFDIGTSNILAAIEDVSINEEGTRVKQDLDIQLANFLEQLTDPQNPGLGKKAISYLESIETLLSTRITRLRQPNSYSKDAYEKYANRYRELINSVFDSKYKTAKTENLDDLRDKIIKLRTAYEAELTAKRYSSDTTDLMARDLQSIAIEAKSAINYDGKVPVIDTETDAIGSFQYTWSNFVKGIKPSAIALSVLLSILLDFLAPLLSITMYRAEHLDL